MDSSGFTRGNAPRARDGQLNRRRGNVEVELPEFAGLGSGDLVKLILQADSARRQLDGYLAALLGGFGDLEGQDAVQELCRQFGLGRHRARQQAKTASALNALPNTLDAAKQGWISIDHARVLGESHQRAPLSTEQELVLITAAITEDLDEFKKTLARSEDQRRADDGLSRHERQRERRSAKVFDGDDEMVILHAELDRIDGTPIDIDELRLIACNASIVPAIFASDGQPLYMGRKQRTATAAQKLALWVRDKSCIGCGMRASACDAHHIIWWDDDGTTDLTNLVLLCPKCHKKVHKQGYTVVKGHSGQYQLRSPRESKARSPDASAETVDGFRQRSLHNGSSSLHNADGRSHLRSAVLSGQ